MSKLTKKLISWAPVIALFLLAAHPSIAQFGGGGFGGGFGRSSRFGGSGGGYGGGYRSYGGSSSYSQSQDGGRVPGTALIEYDNDTGSIIVYTDEDTNEQIKTVITNLDHPVPQVLIKVLFLEVTHSTDLDLGVEASIKTTHGTKDSNTIQSLFGLANESRGGFYKIIDDDFEATIHALAESNKLEVLSRPSILTRNNQQAEITVGQEVPFITNSRITDNGQTINTIEYSDVGIILSVTPHIAPERMVEMQVEPEISTLTADTVPISEVASARVIAKRSASTRVFVGDGKTVVIGGMMENNNTDKVSKIPLLGDIPYVGALFRRTTTTKSKTELLIFLTPLVVENPNDLEHVTRREQDNGTLAPQTFTKGQMSQFLDDIGSTTTQAQASSGLIPFKTERVSPANGRGAALAKRMGGVDVKVEDANAQTKPPLGDQPEVLYEAKPVSRESFRVRRRGEVQKDAGVKTQTVSAGAKTAEAKPAAAKTTVKGGKLVNDTPAVTLKEGNLAVSVETKPVAKTTVKGAKLLENAPTTVVSKASAPAAGAEAKPTVKTTVKGAKLVENPEVPKAVTKPVARTATKK